MCTRKLFAQPLWQVPSIPHPNLQRRCWDDSQQGGRNHQQSVCCTTKPERARGLPFGSANGPKESIVKSCCLGPCRASSSSSCIFPTTCDLSKQNTCFEPPLAPLGQFLGQGTSATYHMPRGGPWPPISEPRKGGVNLDE